jgi:hypothetical protein
MPQRAQLSCPAESAKENEMNRTQSKGQPNERAEPPTIRPGQSDASGEKSDVPQSADDLDRTVVGILGFGAILSRITQQEPERDGAERMNPALQESGDS